MLPDRTTYGSLWLVVQAFFFIWCGLFLSVRASALSLDEALLVSASYAPEILATQADEQVAQATHKAAGTLPEPRLIIGVDDFMLDGQSKTTLSRSKRSISIMQDVPNRAKRVAEKQLAEVGVQTSISQSHFTRLNIQRDVTLVWLELYYLGEKRKVLKRQMQENDLLRSSAKSALRSGGSATSAVKAKLEQKKLADEQDNLQRDEQSAQARLARWVGPDVAKQGIHGVLPQWLEGERTFAAIDQVPELRTTQAQASRAQAELNLAIAQSKPDWSVEVGVGKDAMGGTMAMVQLNIGLPIFASKSVDSKITAASAAVSKAQADHLARRADYIQQYNELLAQRQAYSSQLARLEKEILPLMEQQVKLMLSGYQSGQVALGDVLVARNEQLDARMRQVDLQYKKALLGAQIYYLTGGGQQHE